MGALATAVRIRHDLHNRLLDARARTDEIFRVVREEAMYDRPIPERHRIIFYVGHVEAFDWNLLAQRAFGLRSFQRTFDHLFAFGIDPVDGGLPSDAAADWPTREEVERYNRRLREELDYAIEHALARPEEGHPQLIPMLEVAIEHRLMHAETLAYMLHQLPSDLKMGGSESAAWKAHGVKSHLVEIPAGTATLGMEHTMFWRREGNLWIYRSMFGEIRLPLEWPVYVSHAEATAYAKWLGRKLPTEAEFHRAAYGAPEGGKERSYPWGEEAPSASTGNFNFKSWDPSPVGAHLSGGSAFGVHDLVGNGWEWTRTEFAPFPGFTPMPFYPNYSAKFFDGKHYVMKGGSPRTAACMLRRSFRNWFQPHYPYVYATFRCVED